MDKAHNARARSDISTIENAISRYDIAQGRCPSSLADVGMDTLQAPWGNPYQYLDIADSGPSVVGQVRKDRNLVPLNSDYDLYSMGKDGATLHRLKDLGIRLSIDDFGTGYSSLSYLKRFPIDDLKIDHAFVRPLPGDAESQCIVNAVIALAHGLGLTVMAEGVETAEQYDLLQARSCEVVQGYFIGRPMPAEDFAAQFMHSETPVA